MSKKVAWLLLTLLFTFDNVWSYIAVSRYHLHELNLIIAWVVEEYPLLYFLCIPAEMVMVYLIVLILKKVILMVLKNQNLNPKLVERVILTAIVIYWSIGNSGVNLLSILFHHLPFGVWLVLSSIGIIVSVIYVFLTLSVIQ